MLARAWMGFAGVTASIVGVGCGPTGPSTDAFADTSDTDPDLDTDTGACELPSDGPIGADITTLTIRNDSAVPVYVLPTAAFSCGQGVFQIEVDGEPLKWDDWGVATVPCDSCELGCADTDSYGWTLNPATGSAFVVSWSGAIWASESLSSECVGQQSCDGEPVTECEVRVQFSGEFTAVVELTQDCPSSDPQACACDESICSLPVEDPAQFEVWRRLEVSASHPAAVEFVVVD